MSTKYILISVLFCSNLFSQINVKIIKVIDLPVELTTEEFQHTNFSINTTGFYFLDIVNRQVAYLSNDDNVVFAGGYGTDNDAFIDPIEILSSQLRVWIIDRTENKLIEFDHKLNYLKTIEFDQIYPEFSGVDDWGNILLHSDLVQKIVKSNITTEDFSDFIDLSLWNDMGECITDFHVASDGSIGILINCSNSVYIFNRLGQLDKKLQTDFIDDRFLIKISDSWFTVSTKGQICSVRHNESVNLPIEQTILDVNQMDGNLYILLEDKIWVVDVSLE